jgi:hypothetical protein
MKSTVKVSLLILAGLALSSSGVSAQAQLDAVGVLEQYCADTEDMPHPERIIMRQLVTTDRLATFGGTVFAGIYQAGRQPEVAGTMSIRLRIERKDGRRERLDRIVGHQVANGIAEVLGNFPLAVREGDTVVWRIRFKNFEDLQAGDCFLLIGATMRP